MPDFSRICHISLGTLKYFFSKKTDVCETDVSKLIDKFTKKLYKCSDCNYICKTTRGLGLHRNRCTGCNIESGKDENTLKMKQKDPAKILLKQPSNVNYDSEGTVSRVGSLEEQSDMLTEEMVSITASNLEGHSVTLTSEAIGEKMTSNAELPADLKTSMYVCPECDFYCESEASMKLHYAVCNGGNAASDEDQDILKMKETVPPKKTGSSETDTSKPVDKDKKILYMCKDCRYICGSLLSVKKHKKTCIGEKMPSSLELPADLKTSMYVCPECDFYCASEASMKLHYTACSGAKVSIACQTDDDSQSGACTSGLLNTIPLILSVRPFSSTDNDDAPLPEGKVCTGCQTDPVKIVYERAYCTQCEYSTTRPYNLEKHMKIHSGEKNYPCPYCEKRFREKGSLSIHERTHTGERPYACDICNKTFATTIARNKHKIRLHTTERPFVCDYCRMGFKIKYDLTQHVRTHSSKVFPGKKQYKKME